MTVHQDSNRPADSTQHSRALAPRQGLWLQWNTLCSQSRVFPAAREGDWNVEELHKHILLQPEVTEGGSLCRCTSFSTKANSPI